MMKLIDRASHKSVKTRQLSSIPIILLLTVGFSSAGKADGQLFLPNTLSSNNNHVQVRTLNNTDLALQAELMRSNDMSAEHRALNHQWLAVQSGENKEIQGSKVFSKIAKKTFKEYWRENRTDFGDSALLPDDNGKFKKKYNEVDYDFKLSSRGLKIGFEYEF